MALMKANEVARFFLGSVDEESGDNITNLKLQKLLYYAQGLYVAMNGEPLFDETIEAWNLGPVVPAIYHEIKENRSNPIPRPPGFDPSDYPPEIREFLLAITNVFGQFSAWKLSQMTHAEPPWADAYRPNRNEVIPLEALRDFFVTLVEAGRQGLAIPGEPEWPTESFQFRRRMELSRRMERHRPRLTAIAEQVRASDLILDDDED